jgi:hypothetical protein
MAGAAEMRESSTFAAQFLLYGTSL